MGLYVSFLPNLGRLPDPGVGGMGGGGEGGGVGGEYITIAARAGNRMNEYVFSLTIG
jgi:hypothetical protein